MSTSAPRPRASYHHGSLRQQLLASAVALVEAEGVGAVSLRRLAREAGVSPRAPYHHFGDRPALLAAVCVEGGGLLLEDLRRAREAAGSGTSALAAVIQAYVRFARGHPGHLQLMMRPELCDLARHPEAAHAGEGAVQLLTEIVGDCQREGTAPPGDPTALVAAVWALSVGIVTLWLDGPLADSCADLGVTPEELTARIAALIESLLRRPFAE